MEEKCGSNLLAPYYIAQFPAVSQDPFVPTWYVRTLALGGCVLRPPFPELCSCLESGPLAAELAAREDKINASRSETELVREWLKLRWKLNTVEFII